MISKQTILEIIGTTTRRNSSVSESRILHTDYLTFEKNLYKRFQNSSYDNDEDCNKSHYC